jgi:hypothetical protein
MAGAQCLRRPRLRHQHRRSGSCPPTASVIRSSPGSGGRRRSNTRRWKRRYRFRNGLEGRISQLKAQRAAPNPLTYPRRHRLNTRAKRAVAGRRLPGAVRAAAEAAAGATRRSQPPRGAGRHGLLLRRPSRWHERIRLAAQRPRHRLVLRLGGARPLPARQPTGAHSTKLARRVAAELAAAGWLERVLTDGMSGRRPPRRRIERQSAAQPAKGSLEVQYRDRLGRTGVPAGARWMRRASSQVRDLGRRTRTGLRGSCSMLELRRVCLEMMKRCRLGARSARDGWLAASGGGWRSSASQSTRAPTTRAGPGTSRRRRAPPQLPIIADADYTVSKLYGMLAICLFAAKPD